MGITTAMIARVKKSLLFPEELFTIGILANEKAMKLSWQY